MAPLPAGADRAAFDDIRAGRLQLHVDLEIVDGHAAQMQQRISVADIDSGLRAAAEPVQLDLEHGVAAAFIRCQCVGCGTGLAVAINAQRVLDQRQRGCRRDSPVIGSCHVAGIADGNVEHDTVGTRTRIGQGDGAAKRAVGVSGVGIAKLERRAAIIAGRVDEKRGGVGAGRQRQPGKGERET